MKSDNHNASAVNMLEGNPWETLVVFALPLMIGNAFQQVYSLTDAAVVGRTLGINALAALGACDTLLFLVNSSIQSFASGCGIRVSTAYGEGDQPRVQDAVCASGICCLAFGCILCVIMQLCIPWILHILQVQPAVAPLTRLYLRIICLGIPLVTVYQYFFAVIRAMGNSKRPLQIMIVSSCVNIVLDILFVCGLGWGIAGAAIATVIAQGISVVYGLLAIRQTVPYIDLCNLPTSLYLIPHVLGLAMPMSLQMAVCCISSLIVQAAINGCDISFVAGYTSSNKLYGLLEVAAIAYGFALTTYISQNAGHGNRLRILAGVRAGEGIALITAAILMIAMFVWQRPLVQLFMSGEALDLQPAIMVGRESLMALAVGLPILYSLYVLKSVLQGLGDVRFSSASSIGEFAARVIIVLMATQLHMPRVLYLSEPAAWGMGSIILLIGLLRRIHHGYAIAD